MARFSLGGGKSRGGDRLALDFRADAIVLFATDADGAWIEIGATELTVDDLETAVRGLQAQAQAVFGVEADAADIWLPEDQILTIETQAADLSAEEDDARSALEDALEQRTVVALDELYYDMAPSARGWVASAAERTVVQEARAYARKWGFAPLRATTRFGHPAFALGPTFGPVKKAPLVKKPSPALFAGGGLAVAAAAVGLFLVLAPSAPELIGDPPAVTDAAPMSLATTDDDEGPPAPFGPNLRSAAIEAPTLADVSPPPTVAPEAAALIADIEETDEPSIGDAAETDAPILLAETELASQIAAIKRPFFASAPPVFDAFALPLERAAAVVFPSGEQPPIRLARLSPALTIATAGPDAVYDDAGITGPATPQLTLAALPRDPVRLDGVKATPLFEVEEPPGPGSVKLAPPPRKRPDALDMTPSENVAKLAPAPKSRPRSIKPPPRALASSSASNRVASTRSRSAPAGPGVANAATLSNAITLEEMNLLGIYTSGGSRRALLRLPSGEIMRVSKGAVVDGWVISRIDARSMRMTRGGQAETLNIVQ